MNDLERKSRVESRKYKGGNGRTQTEPYELRLLQLSYRDVPEAMEMLRQLHYRAVGQESTKSELSKWEARVRYETVLVGILVAIRQMPILYRELVFDDLISVVKESESFDGLESVFATSLHEMNIMGNRDRVRDGVRLWQDIGPPKFNGGNLEGVLLSDPRSRSIIVMPRLSARSDLAIYLNDLSLQLCDWLSKNSVSVPYPRLPESLPRLEEYHDRPGDESDADRRDDENWFFREDDPVTDLLHRWQQRGVRKVRGLIPDQPYAPGEYIVAIISPAWIGPIGASVAIHGVAIPTLLEAGWSDFKVVGGILWALGGTIYAEGESLYSGPERRDDGGHSESRRGVVEQPDGGEGAPGAPPSDSGSGQSDRRGSRGSGSGGDAGPGAGGSGGSDSPREIDSYEGGDTGSDKKEGDDGTSDQRDGQDDGPESNVYEGTGLEVITIWPSGDITWDDTDLPSDTEGTGGRSKSDIGGSNIPRPGWRADFFYRIVYGELWWLSHPEAPRVLEVQEGAADEEKLRVGGKSSETRSGGLGDDDLGDDLPYDNLGTGGHSDLHITVQLPVPDDIRPMPPK